tara:strand:+ start:571 stop:948 length:378 start_codon:yes stop_codon:yes gene_type:complete
MFQMLIGPIANLASTFMESKVEKTKAKAKAQIAKAEAEAEVMKVAATHEAGWEKIMAEASKDSWKDEAWTILFIAIIAASFLPWARPYIAEGFAALETAPAWFTYSVYASIAASFGLRGIKGFKK